MTAAAARIRQAMVAVAIAAVLAFATAANWDARRGGWKS
jgi:hypothetical protein